MDKYDELQMAVNKHLLKGQDVSDEEEKKRKLKEQALQRLHKSQTLAENLAQNFETIRNK